MDPGEGCGVTWWVCGMGKGGWRCGIVGLGVQNGKVKDFLRIQYPMVGRRCSRGGRSRRQNPTIHMVEMRAPEESLSFSLSLALSLAPPPPPLLSLALSASAERSARGGVERCGTAPQSQDHILVLTFKVQGKGCQLFFNCSIFTRNPGGGGYVVKEPDQPLERVHKARPRPVKHLFAFAFSTWVWVKGLGVGDWGLGLGFGVGVWGWGLGLGFGGLRFWIFLVFEILGLRIGVWSLRFMVSGFGFWVLDFGFCVLGLGIANWSLGIGV